MKRFIVFAMLGFAAITAAPAKAQVSVNINIGSQPDWGPRDYDYVNYYYLPEVESYYYVPTRKFIYRDGGRWIHTSNLPSRYRGYNLHSGRKVVINANKPYLRHQQYRTRYAGNRYYAKPQRVVHHSNHRSKEYSKHRKQEFNHNRGGKQISYRQEGRKHNNKGNQRGNSHGNSRGNGQH